MVRILVIGDKEVDLKFLKVILSKSGYEVLSEYDFKNAQDNIADVKPDLIIIDAESFDWGGLELCRSIVKNRKYTDIPILPVCDLTDGDAAVSCFECGVSDYLSKPINENEVKVRVAKCLEDVKEHTQARTDNAKITADIKAITEKITHPQAQTVFALANLAQSRDDASGKHLERMQKYIYVLTESLRKNPKYKDTITDEFTEDITSAGPLHDIGKIGIPDKILLKPGRLTSEEYEVIKTHTTIGAETLENMEKTFGSEGFIRCGKIIAKYHHERPDGTGYPNALSASEIPIEASITAIADVYDALRTKKVYKPAMSRENCKEFIKSGRGTQFDPDVVDAFLAVEKTFDSIWKEYITMSF